MMFRNFKFIQHKNKEKGSKRDTDGRNRVQVLVPFSALAAIAGLLSFDVASVSRYHFQIRRPREVKESEGNPFVGFLLGIRHGKEGVNRQPWMRL